MKSKEEIIQEIIETIRDTGGHEGTNIAANEIYTIFENELQEDKESFLKTIQNREDEIHTHISRVQELEKEIKEYKKLAKDNVPELVKMLKNRKV